MAVTCGRCDRPVGLGAGKHDGTRPTPASLAACGADCTSRSARIGSEPSGFRPGERSRQHSGPIDDFGEYWLNVRSPPSSPWRRRDSFLPRRLSLLLVWRALFLVELVWIPASSDADCRLVWAANADRFELACAASRAPRGESRAGSAGAAPRCRRLRRVSGG